MSRKLFSGLAAIIAACVLLFLAACKTDGDDSSSVIIIPEPVTVTFDPHFGSWNGNFGNKTVEVKRNTIVTAPDAPVRGVLSTFIDWYTEETGGEQFNFSTPITESLTLYARWQTNTLNSIADITTYLTWPWHPANAANSPLFLPVMIDLGTMTQTNSNWQNLLNAINTANKFVVLDLSLCSMNGTVFNPVYNVSAGKDKITAIVLPDVATSTANGESVAGGAVFSYFTNLKYFNGRGLTSIGNLAFYECTSLALTFLPAGLTSIGISAFKGCTGLALTSLPAGLTSIGLNAFEGCTGLALTSLPAGLTSIEQYAFNSCTRLALTSLPAGLTSIDQGTFIRCTSLVQITLPAGLTSINSNAFYGCSNLGLVICKAPTPPTLGTDVFSNTPSIIQIKVPAGSVDAYKAASRWSNYASRISAE